MFFFLLFLYYLISLAFFLSFFLFWWNFLKFVFTLFFTYRTLAIEKGILKINCKVILKAAAVAFLSFLFLCKKNMNAQYAYWLQAPAAFCHLSSASLPSLKEHHYQGKWRLRGRYFKKWGSLQTWASLHIKELIHHKTLTNPFPEICSVQQWQHLKATGWQLQSNRRIY